MTTHRAWIEYLCAGGLLIAAAGRLLAGEPPAPEGTDAKPVRLVYRYRAGQVEKYQSEYQGDVTLNPASGGSTQVNLKMHIVQTAKVLGTRNGTATTRLVPTSVTMQSDLPLGTVVVKLVGNRKSVTLNGQPLPQEMMEKQGGRLTSFLKQVGMTVRRTERGYTTTVNAPAASAPIFPPTYFVLPPKSVVPGDTWESSLRVQADAGGAGPSSTAGVMVQFIYTLRQIEMRHGKPQALIDLTGSIADQNSANSVNVQGTGRFDIARGTLASGQYTEETNLSGPDGGQVQSNVQVVFRQLPPVAAKPAPKKKH